MMEIPSKTVAEEWMDFKKFSQSTKNLIYTNDKVFIEGVFKDEGSDKIIALDNFWANAIHTSGKPINAEEIYKTYLEWFNYTLRRGERKRLFVSAKIKQDAICVDGEL